MPIRIEHGKPETLLTAAQIKGEERAAQQQLERTERLQAQQQEFEYRTALKQQDMAIDLQMQERAKQWEIQKMELRSQVDFQREEQARQRKLDSYDNIDAQLDKEVQSGRLSEKDVELYRFKNNLARQGMNVSISELRQQQEEDRYGVRPYYTDPEFERDYPELAAAKKRETISGVRKGTVPYYLDPEWLRANRDIAMSVLEKHEIMLEEEDIDAMIKGATPELPLGDKQLDIGVQAEQPELIFKGYGKREPGTLDTATARQILTEAGGDREKARQIARQRGYNF